MPTSPAGNKRPLIWAPACAGALSRKRESGFTLIELMIVITIIGLASAAVVWSLPDPRGRLTDEAARFAGRARAAHDLAIVTARPVSVWVSAGGYGFDERQGGAWAPITEKPLRVTRWSEGTRALPGAVDSRDRVTFDSTGFADRPLVVTLERAGETRRVDLGIDGGVKIGG